MAALYRDYELYKVITIIYLISLNLAQKFKIYWAQNFFKLKYLFCLPLDSAARDDRATSSPLPAVTPLQHVSTEKLYKHTVLHVLMK